MVPDERAQRGVRGQARVRGGALGGVALRRGGGAALARPAQRHVRALRRQHQPQDQRAREPAYAFWT